MSSPKPCAAFRKNDLALPFTKAAPIAAHRLLRRLAPLMPDGLPAPRREGDGLALGHGFEFEPVARRA